ncbi:MAG: hypothetical protein HBSAPP03_20940 [Phycisphaerae bacterium]|nr:MAG: hypothetical protein HBSAPP03_20940 [Phycisphaerae bacterium]
MPHDVFISYSSHDKAHADAVCAGLEAAGVRCWIAPRDIPAGRTYAGEIVASIKAARVMVVIFSSHSNASANVMREVERAINAGVAILPFRIEDVKPTNDMEYFLSVPHWLDALTPPLESHIERLRGQVRQMLGIATPPPFAASPPPLTNQAPQGTVAEIHPDDWSRKGGQRKGLFGRLLDSDS